MSSSREDVVSDPIVRPSFDAWVGVDLEVLRFVQALEVQLNNLSVRLETIELEHREELARRDQIISERGARIQKLEREVGLLREKANLSSRNSSKPPSSDPPGAPKRAPKPKRKRSRGGQHGHSFCARPLVPADQLAPEQIRDHRPEQCRACGERLEGTDSAPWRHQVVDLPVPAPLVVEHRLHALSCPSCGVLTRATLPDDVGASGFGPGVEAAVATLWSACRLSHRVIRTTMADLFGVAIGLGSISNILSRVGRHVAAPVSETRESVREAEETKHADETGWFQRGADGSNPSGRRAWLWVVATSAVTIFEVAMSRSQSVAKRLLGGFVRGVVVTDRYASYGYIELDQRQVCWAHLYRDFVRMGERSGEAGRIGRKLERLAETLFELWERRRAGRLRPEVWESETAALRFRMRGLLERGARLGVRADEQSERTRTKNTCGELLEVEAAIWHFLSDPEIGITNNLAERQLRHAVLWRRASFGSQSARGAELVAALLTVVMTRRKQGRSVHAYFVEACRAARARQALPSLVHPTI
jgi:transposase